MSQNRRRFTLMMLALFASLFTVNVLQDKQVHAKGKNEPRLEGQLVSPIGINRIAAVRRQNGQVVSIYIPTTAKLERNNVHVSLTAFKAGDRVQARFTPDGKTVTKFEGVGT